MADTHFCACARPKPAPLQLSSVRLRPGCYFYTTSARSAHACDPRARTCASPPAPRMRSLLAATFLAVVAVATLHRSVSSTLLPNAAAVRPATPAEPCERLLRRTDVGLWMWPRSALQLQGFVFSRVNMDVGNGLSKHPFCVSSPSFATARSWCNSTVLVAPPHPQNLCAPVRCALHTVRRLRTHRTSVPPSAAPFTPYDGSAPTEPLCPRPLRPSHRTTAPHPQNLCAPVRCALHTVRRPAPYEGQHHGTR